MFSLADTNYSESTVELAGSANTTKSVKLSVNVFVKYVSDAGRIRSYSSVGKTTSVQDSKQFLCLRYGLPHFVSTVCPVGEAQKGTRTLC